MAVAWSLAVFRASVSILAMLLAESCLHLLCTLPSAITSIRHCTTRRIRAQHETRSKFVPQKHSCTQLPACIKCSAPKQHGASRGSPRRMRACAPAQAPDADKTHYNEDGLERRRDVQGLLRKTRPVRMEREKFVHGCGKRRLTRLRVILTPSTRLVSVREGAGWSFFRFRG